MPQRDMAAETRFLRRLYATGPEGRKGETEGFEKKREIFSTSLATIMGKVAEIRGRHVFCCYLNSLEGRVFVAGIH